jgi:DNA replication regulator DPB11
MSLNPIPTADNSPPSSSAPQPEPTPSPSEDSHNQDEPEEIAAMKRLPAITLKVWQSLLKPRGFEIADGKLVRSPSKSQEYEKPLLPLPPLSPRPTTAKAPPVGAAEGSIISAFRRANSFAPQRGDASASRHQPFRRTSTLGALPPRWGNAEAGPSSVGAISCCPDLFAGLRFRALGEARCANVRGAIEGSGGLMVSEDAADDVDYIIVRLVRCVPFIFQMGG